VQKQYAVTIPAYHPSKNLPNYVKNLAANGVPCILVVNDGNSPKYDSIFLQLSDIPECVVLNHSVNKGKGAAMKTAFRYFLERTESWKGIVTADADDQHAVEDVVKVGDELVKDGTCLVLGSRTFEYGKVPTRSYIGNTLTSFVFKQLFKCSIRDTQTGLRGIDRHSLQWITRLRGEKFDYEMNMLINAAKRKIPVKEMTIQTIYHKNHQSNYRSYQDSIRIIRHLLTGFFTKKSLPRTKAEEEAL